MERIYCENINMKRFILLTLFLVFYLSLYSQDEIKISPPEVTFINDILTIRYDITGCGTSDIVDIELIILNSRGARIRPSYITGDIGSSIRCGFGKKIEWNMVKDSVLIDEDIEVQVTGTPHIPEIPLYTQPVTKRVSRGNVVISSFFIPGLGQMKASGKGAHLIFSGLVYGALGSSLYLNMKSNKYYDDYLVAGGTERDELYDKSVNIFNISQYLLYGGAGAWLGNMIWSAVIPIKETEKRRMELSFESTPQQYGYLLSAKWSF